ncbi:MAG TPA: sigma-70 family RNA polymerase sigma factor [Gemmataceae bacterium]
MTDTPTTQASLLVRLGDAADAPAWGQFVDLYAPPVYACGRRHGLQDADAADVTQDVLRAVHRAFRRGDYDPRRGPFRAWLFTVVRNKLRDFARRAGLRERPENCLADVPARGGDPAAEFEQECERRLFAWAADQVRGRFRPVTWQAFWRTAVDGTAGKDVAAELGLTVAAVYLAKGRVMAALREQIRAVEGNDEIPMTNDEGNSNAQ